MVGRWKMSLRGCGVGGQTLHCVPGLEHTVHSFDFIYIAGHDDICHPKYFVSKGLIVHIVAGGRDSLVTCPWQHPPPLRQ